jgi:hypothetical protein
MYALNKNKNARLRQYAPISPGDMRRTKDILIEYNMMLPPTQQ